MPCTQILSQISWPAKKPFKDAVSSQLGDRVTNGKSTQHQALLLGVPLELTVAVVTTMTL